ncbi:MAG: peptidoglycan DD-metalloendopeptidase family protein [Clostridia bacterium]|nr:peptidoglycan DD-metalloendopeptidase family protein [Clostridia bacterium]
MTNRRTSALLRILTLILCAVLTVCAVGVSLSQTEPELTADAKTSKDVDKEIAECEKLIQSLNAELKQWEEQLKEVGNLTKTAKDRADLLASKIQVLQTNIELNESLLESCSMKRATAQAEIYLVQHEYEYYEEIFAELMRFIYERGNISDFELIFSSSSLAEYLERRDDFTSAIDCVEDLTQNLSQSYAHLLDLDQEYEVAETKYKEYIDDLDAQKQELESAKAELESVAAELGLGTDQISGEYAKVSETLAAAKSKLSSLRKEREALYKQEQLEKELNKKPDVHTDYLAPSKLSSQGFAWPLELGISYRISSYFATRTNPITGQGTEFHQGLDIACAGGTRILASKSGIVQKAETYGGYGNCVIIYHGEDKKGRSVTTLYGHAKSLACKKGQSVAQGDVIAYVGTTGRSTGNHLHFSVLLDGKYVDPDDYLPDGYYTKLPND